MPAPFPSLSFPGRPSVHLHVVGAKHDAELLGGEEGGEEVNTHALGHVLEARHGVKVLLLHRRRGLGHEHLWERNRRIDDVGRNQYESCDDGTIGKGKGGKERSERGLHRIL